MLICIVSIPKPSKYPIHLYHQRTLSSKAIQRDPPNAKYLKPPKLLARPKAYTRQRAGMIIIRSMILLRKHGQKALPPPRRLLHLLRPPIRDALLRWNSRQRGTRERRTRGWRTRGRWTQWCGAWNLTIFPACHPRPGFGVTLVAQC